MLSRWFWGSTEPKPGALAEASVIGGAIGVLAVIVIGLLGVSELPSWTFVPAIFVGVQVGLSRLLDWLMNRWFPRYPGSDSGPSYEELVFLLFGVITLPPLALFLVTMTVLTLV